jgi:hypothetical protein
MGLPASTYGTPPPVSRKLGLSIHFLSKPGATYTVQFRDDLNDTYGFRQFKNNGVLTAVSQESAFEDDFTSNTSGSESISGKRFYSIYSDP